MENKEEFMAALKGYMGKIAARMEAQMPLTGEFEKFHYYFEIPCETIREFHVFFEVDLSNPKDGRVVSGGAALAKDNRMVTVELFRGTKIEITQYLKKPGIEEEIWKTIEEIYQSCGQEK